MAKSSKTQVLRRLHRALEGIPRLREQRYDCQEFTRWDRDTKVALAYTFGEESSQYKEFEALHFSPIILSTSTPESRFQDWYLSGLRSAQTLLESMMAEVEDYWEEAVEPSSGSHNATDAERTTSESTPRTVPDARKVFVVHGRNTAARDAMFSFLRAVRLDPIEWSEAIRLTGKPNPFVGEVLDAAFSHARAVLVLMTPDETAALLSRFVMGDDTSDEKGPGLQPRPNVLFEAGMAMGRAEERTVLVQLGDTRQFSDIGGRHVIRLTNNPKSRQDLADRLGLAGCVVDISNRDWQTTGDFDASIAGIAADARVARSDRPSKIRHEDLDESDKKAMLASWFTQRPAAKKTQVIEFSAVDDEIGLPRGTAKRYLKQIAGSTGHLVREEGPNMILFF